MEKNKQKIVYILISLLFCIYGFFPVKAEEKVITSNEEIELRSNNAILINLNDDRILYDKNAKDKIYPASMTKIMTTLVALENIEDLNAHCVITEVMLQGLREANASVAGFQVNESVSYRDLLYGILLPSGADAAAAVAISIFNDEATFVAKMNEKAASLNMQNTHFVNVSGLHDDAHYSTVADIALLLKAALQNETFKSMFCTKVYQCENGLWLYSTMHKQAEANEMDVSFINGAKTGFTNEASLCLASYVEKNDEKYIMVSAQTNSDFQYPYHIADALHLYQYIFDHYERMNVIKKGDLLIELPIKWGKVSTYSVYADKDISILVKDKNIKALKKSYHGNHGLEAPLYAEDVIGTYTINDNDVVAYTMEIKMKEGIERNLWVYYLNHLDQFFIDFKYSIGIFLMVCLGLFAYHYYKKQK